MDHQSIHVAYAKVSLMREGYATPPIAA